MNHVTVDLEAIVQAVVAELRKRGSASASVGTPPIQAAPGELVIDLPDPTLPEFRRAIGVEHPHDLEGLRNLCATTTARLGVGRAGPRPRTNSLLLFQFDHGITQDAIYGEVSESVKEKLGLFTVMTQVSNRDEYLLRPDLGRKLSDTARKTIAERCVKKPQVQIVVGDGLSAAAVNNNVPEIYPVIEQGFKSAGISIGTPFFIQNARVGVINDVNEVVGADVVVILLGERPGLGVADALSAYMGYKPGPGKTDAERDVVCMITYHGGTNPLEAGAYVVELIKQTLKYQASGIELKLKASGGE
ncbi:MAG: ethanolamine ammonia-lyase subunit EutC [Anaerolineae bacterium]|nr:ethanolamine ammonia-lyase subunit EutC [Anaerolineae bacterium]